MKFITNLVLTTLVLIIGCTSVVKAENKDQVVTLDYKAFHCPESLSSDDERGRAIHKYLEWVVATHGNWTLEQTTKYRLQLLVSHNCAETLQNIAQHDE